MLNKRQFSDSNDKLDVPALHNEAIQTDNPCTARVNTPRVIVHTRPNTDDQIRSRGVFRDKPEAVTGYAIGFVAKQMRVVL